MLKSGHHAPDQCRHLVRARILTIWLQTAKRKETDLILLSQVYSSWNTLLSWRTDSANHRLQSSRSANCNVCHHCDRGLSRPQLGHLAHHLLGCHTEESPQVFGWHSQCSHHSLGDLIQVSPTFSLQHMIPSIRPLQLLVFTCIDTIVPICLFNMSAAHICKVSCAQVNNSEVTRMKPDLQKENVLKSWSFDNISLFIGPMCLFFFPVSSPYQSHCVAWKTISTWING